MILTLNKGDGAQLSRNFPQKEMDCRCTSSDCKITLFDPHLIYIYQFARKIANGPIFAESGYRCEAHNKQVGGEDGSYHTKGQAIDLHKSSGFWTPTEASQIRHEMKDYGGVGLYILPTGNYLFLHLDCGPYRNWTIKV